MKRIACLVLLIAILLQSGGLMLFYQARRTAVYNEMHSSRSTRGKVVQQLTIDLATLKAALVDKNEILYQGEMYDVESLTISGDKVLLQVIKDKKEQRLIAQIDKLGGSKKNQADFMKRLMQLLTVAYMPPPPSFHIVYVAYSVSAYPVYAPGIESLSGSVLLPPPKFS